ncbi:cilia- and flagella-associated protein 47-like [Ptychodera flava]|uniref:cilia- and flagella-associated protein 47-like n=1 Tax=Ptychodera flava TaxID=63121 RepID=UPI00396A65AB
MENDIAGVRIDPPVVEFVDAGANVLHSIVITVQNISKSSKVLKFHRPTTNNFRLKVRNPDKPIAPGLELKATIEYFTDVPKDCHDRVILLVDDDVIEIPLFAYCPQPLLELEGPVDFGAVTANHRVLSKEISLYNHGSVSGDFKIKYDGPQPIVILPNSGTVRPKTAQIIKIEFVTKTPGTLAEEAKVKLEGQEPCTLCIKAEVVQRSLELFSIETQQHLHCVKFGETYYGTDRTEGAILYNNGPDPVSFVTIMQVGAIGEELGTDLSKSTAAMLSTVDKSSTDTKDMTSLFTAIPNQGVLGPYQQLPVFFRFSPRFNSSKQGWKGNVNIAPRQDYAIFVNIEMVGSNDGFADTEDKTENGNRCKVELALTGTALPVLINVSPQSQYDFGECQIGEHVDTLCTLKNESTVLPVSFVLRPIAQFASSPPVGKLLPGQTRDVIFSFKPNQYGGFKKIQYLDILGPVADDHIVTGTHLAPIHTIHIALSGVSNPQTTKRQPKFNPGITPLVVGEVGQFVDVTFDRAKPYDPRAATLNAVGSKGIHVSKSATQTRDDMTLVSYPNDMARSVRPSYRRENYATIFTKNERYTYVDPDYAFTDEELAARKDHRDYYVNYIKDLREQRQAKEKSLEFNELNNETDIGLKPASGLKSPQPKVDQIKERKKAPVSANGHFKMLSTKRLAEAENAATSRPVSDGLNAVPMSKQEKHDCKIRLTPQELHQITIGPPTINFGEVCLKSTSIKYMDIVNNLRQYIHVVVDIDCRELRQTSPLSQVIPPNSKAQLPLIFESNTKGRFQRNVTYTVNACHQDHVIVFAEVVPVALQLSSNLLTLKPTPGMPAEAGLRDVITLQNKRNYPADFTWQPILGERGTAFSIRPATGTVDAFKDLECEVVFHPSYHAPEDGQFALQVHGGSTLKLNCTANLGPTQVQFIERRILFGSVPLHLTTTRTAQLYNTSQNHAYFQVIDSTPFPGLSVTPTHGVVPVGGIAEIKVQLTPTAVLKFDTRVQIAIRGWKTIDLRMGGTVEPPVVDIDMPSFHLGGVYCGSKMIVPFQLINKAQTRAKVEFDLSRYTDFSLKFHGDVMEESEDSQNPGVYKVTVGGEDVIKCELTFQPSEVAAYDFIIPVSINQTDAPTPNPTPFPPTPAPSSKSINHIITPRPVAVTIATPRRRIIATGLRQPLQLSHTKLDFSLPSGFFEMGVQQGLYGQSKGTMMVNNSDKELKWNIDFRGSNKALEEGVFRFLQSNGKPFAETEDELIVGGYLKPGETYALGILFCPGAPGCYETKATLIINDDYNKPYRHLHLIGELKAPNLKFDPLAIVLTPVPLCTEISEEFSIHASGFRKETVIDVDLPDIEMDDGSTLSVLSVTFQKDRPFNHAVLMMAMRNHFFSIPVTATADNCLLTAYPFIAKHRADHQIVTEQGKSVKGRRSQSKESLNVGEAVIMPVDSPTRPSTRASTSSTSRFVSTTSTYEDSSASVTESTYPSTPRDGAANHLAMDAEMEGNSRQDLASRSLGSAAFPNEDTEEGLFHQEVLMAVQRWITLQGWPGGPNPVTIPDGLRSGVTRNSLGEAAADKPPRGVDAGSGSSHKKGLSRTVYDLVAHLTGKAVPGIPINQPLPADATERVLQLHWQHSTLLTFLRGQGASVAFIKPEYLLGPKDYRRWVKLQEHIKSQKRERESRQKAKIEIEVTESVLDEALFESVSKRAWTDLILQILKVLLLARITPRQFRTMPSPGSVALPTINPNPTCSNVYSVGERILLSWLNHHYEQQRHVIWKDCGKGGVPPSRWIVNFDFDLLDGLVLAAVLAAHIPFLAKSHLDEMYTFPNTAEQCLHNTLKVVSAFKCIGLDYDIQAIDITDPNPVALLFLCAHLYQRLPHYIPKASVEFIGTLHSSVLRQVRLTNPSNKSLIYHASISGRDARDFNLPRGDQVTISPRGKSDLPVEFTSRYLRPAEAYLVLVGRRAGSATAATMVFTLRTAIDNIEPLHVYKIENPCYELYKVMINVNNPFDEAGEFRVVMVESSSNFPMSDNNAKSGFLKSKPTEAKKVKSKIDHGQRKERAPSPPKADDVAVKMNTTLEGDKGNQLSYFFCSQSLVHLSLNESATVEVEFLPFNPGHRQCSILLINEKIGEFLYSIEAIATLPSPSMVPYRPSPSSVRISSAAAAGSGRGIYGGDERIIYWRCETNNTLQEEIHIPIANKARENALVIAAQQRMSSKEIERRKITGTLSSSSVTAAIAKLELASSSREDILTKFKSPATLANKDTKSKVFEVELSSKFFSAPATVTLTLPSKTRVQTVREGGGEMSSPTQKSSAGLVLEEGAVPLAIKFVPKGSGHYPCRVTLRAPNDIRVYQIECTVNPEGTAAEIEFTAPVHQSITQEIPIVNQTPHDWPLQASIEGFGFHGPPYILAKAMQTSYYPLMFRPSLESYSSGKLVLHNVDNNTDHIFHLQGLGQKPLALDHITLQCQARQVVTQTIKVPNVTSNKMVYRAVSDLNIITGPPVMTVLPGQEEDYTLMASPWKRGTFKGILSFIAGGTANLNDADSDGEDASRPESGRSGQSNQSAQSNASKASTSSKTKKKSSKDKVARRQGYRVWYSVEVVSQPPPPENTLEITCAAQSAAVMEVSISNPTVNDLTFDVIVEGEGLSGSESMSLTPAQRTMYQLTYAPAVVGEFTGSLIFQNEQVGEFWYNLKLIAETPAPVVLPHMECELGKWTRQYIELSNPTEETLQLTPSNTNPNNFTLEIDMDRKIVLAPHSSINIPLQFMPSCLGQGDHAAKIAFTCPQLGDLVYMSSGNGLTPRPVDPVSISASLGANTSLIIPFRNPMDQTVLVDVILSDNKDVITGVNAGLDKNIVQSDSAFCLLLKNPSNIPVPAKTNIDIPLTFAPDNMNLHEALLIISVRKEDGSSWEYLPSSQPDHPCARRDTDRRDATGGLKDIRWLYPIHGIPESHPVSDSNVAVIECQTRSRIEERLEAILMGAVPSSASGYQAMKTRALTPKDSSRPSSSDGVVVGEGNTLAEEFSYEILYDDDESKATLGNSIALSLLRKQRDKSNGIMTLIFNIVFAPFKVMHYDVNLRITAATGGVWTFPVRFVSTEPIADDVITIEAAGLNKTSAVGFRLTSQARHPVAFNAYFVAGSDAEFSVSPQSGELLPLGTNGSLLSVSFTPRIYGKTYIGKLVVQTADMQWTYDVQGITPSYTPPTGQSERPIAGPHPFPKYRRRPVNYVRENLKLTTTAISSPVKGAQVLRSRQVFT